MDPVTALGLLLANLDKIAAFGAAIGRARAEGRNLTPEEVEAAGVLAQASLDALDAKIDAAGG